VCLIFNGQIEWFSLGFFRCCEERVSMIGLYFFFVQIRMKLSPGMSTYAFVNPVETELQLPPINNITPPQLIVFVMTRN
jgi:uncharacterized membrane protein